MGNYKYSFFDNQLIGVDHLNETVKRLVSGGISAVFSGVDFNVSDINDLNKAILTGGVVPGSDMNLKVTPLNNGTYLINPGICFFNDGTSMEVLPGGEVIAPSSGQRVHIYLISDKTASRCSVKISESELSSGEFVYLAIIEADGSVTDKRVYARGKVPGYYSSSQGMEVNVSYTYSPGDIAAGRNIEVPVGEGNFKHLITVSNGALFYCEFENGASKNQSGAPEVSGRFYLYYDNYNVGKAECDKNVEIRDGKLIIPVLNGFLNKDVTVWYHLW